MDAFDLQHVSAIHPDSDGQGNDNLTAKTTNEKAILLSRQRRLSLRTAVKFRYAAIAVSWVSLVTSLVLGVLSIVFAWIHDSQSLFSFGLDALLDCITSVIIFWRFHGGDTLYSDDRERRACCMIGCLFVVGASILLTKSLFALVRKERTEEPYLTLVIAGVNVGVCFIVGTSKIYIGRELESRALVTDSVTTLSGCVMAIFTLAFSSVYRTNKRLWYLDDVVGILCCVFLAGFGIRVMYVSILEGRKSDDGEEH